MWRGVQVIVWFWEAVHGFTEAQKKRLLAFVTGSDRVPIRGLASLQPPFVISRNGPASDRLPTAHTCFNHLLLPAYAVSCPLSIPAQVPRNTGRCQCACLARAWPRYSPYSSLATKVRLSIALTCLSSTPASSPCCRPPVL